MTLEDARILEYFHYWSGTLLPNRNHRLAVSQILVALATIERHLPALCYHPFKHYVWLGSMQARGAVFHPYP